MRTWRVRKHGEPREALEFVEVPEPKPGPGMLRVRVAASALGLPDLLMCRGSYPLTPELPFTPGQELAGVVEEAGEGCEARPGERVMGVTGFTAGHGGFAEQALAGGRFGLPVPESMSDPEAAAFVIPYHTAYWGLVRRGQLRAGETLLVLGAAGGTGSAALQLGRALGARTIATAGGPDKAAFCRELGADVVIDYRGQDIAEAVRDATEGRGADVVYDPVGGDAFVAAANCIAAEGRILAVGFASGRWAKPSVPHLAAHNYSIVGVIPGGDRAFKLAAQEELLCYYGNGEIRVPVHRVLPFESLPEGLEELARGRVMGKSVLSVSGEEGSPN